ncbi:MAG TPA: universal stress protein [Bacillus sp. (in: firmicutes)]|nr:universal stress protein [Bacillus sp. (in: firmicutes)]
MEMAYKNILVAVDGSKEAEWAFKKAVSIAKRNDARLILCYVVDVRNLATYELYDYTVIQKAEEFAKELVTSYYKSALESGLQDVSYVIEHGSPKTKISKEVAAEYGVDLIVCGATGLNAIERVLIGSVSQHILRYAKCDVIVVRTPKGEEQEAQPAELEFTE